MTSKLAYDNLLGHLGRVYPDSAGEASTVWDYAYANCNALLALMCSKVMWPDFIEMDDMVFLPSVIENEDDRCDVMNYLSQCGSRHRVEQSFNRFEIVNNLFSDPKGLATDREIDELAMIIAEMWKQRLRIAFPQKTFVVDVEISQDDPTAIVVYQQP